MHKRSVLYRTVSDKQPIPRSSAHTRAYAFLHAAHPTKASVSGKSWFQVDVTSGAAYPAPVTAHCPASFLLPGGAGMTWGRQEGVFCRLLPAGRGQQGGSSTLSVMVLDVCGAGSTLLERSSQTTLTQLRSWPCVFTVCGGNGRRLL
jgi:hypothetical protein